ncbi:hypothetical protein [Methylobacterium sp. Leaf118]|uniref:hypothetical protein n=1 Tax=Methylobacterium sp. Leaf118 TaxID=2876562 RepID=UPI001E3B2912|nr:hypothetical protein [Methylobacterium sp. Leaf118]
MRAHSLLLVLAGPLLAAPVVAAPEAAAPPPEAVKAHGAVATRLLPGANSFTAEQTRARLDALGFADVAELRLDDQGIWRGRATHAGRTVAVGLDFRGEVAAD